MVGVTELATESADSTELELFVTKIEYTEEGDMPVTHVFGRDSDERRHWIEVTGHRPSFLVDNHVDTEQFSGHYAVHDITEDTKETLHGESLTRIETKLPKHVSDLREHFATTYEADVLYPKRWQIDTGVKTGIRIDTSQQFERDVKGDIRVPISAVEPLSMDETPGVKPLTCTFDIEVASEDGFPEAEEAEWPVSTIVAHDSYTDEYVGWLLSHPQHGSEITSRESLRDEAELDDVRVFDDEQRLLTDFNEYIQTLRPDILTGWFSNDFDIPYLINRCRNEGVWSYKQWSPLEEVWTSRFDPVVKGINLVDGIAAYRKTQIHNLTSEKLHDVAAAELERGKLEVPDGHTEMWKQQPVQFLKYNKVDVSLTKDIAIESGSIEMLDNLRVIAGGDYNTFVGGNIDMMDLVFLRKAHERNIGLPTAVKPDVEDYHGAYVYTPEAGIHKHVVYPDYSSLYPNMMYQCNISPETLIGTEDDLEASEYDESDCVWTYIDTATDPGDKEDVEASDDRMERLYFTSPSVQTGFIRDVLDDIMGLADEYSGGMYDAAKRVRNSCYGVTGDSNSYNRGFRLYDWRLAEGTTLGGQKVLKEGGRVFAEAVDDSDARVVYGDTDSVVTTIPNANSGEDALQQAFDAAEIVNEHLDEYTQETFGLQSGDSRMELEIESYADGIFFKGAENGTSEDGIKKRYVQKETWNDDDLWLDDPEIEITGFEYVRSDVAQVTKDVQYRLFDAILSEDAESARESFYEYLDGVITDIMADEYDMSDVGKVFGIGQPVEQYGSVDRTPQPSYRGAKYANACIYQADAIGEGDRPLLYYVKEGCTGPDLRSTYTADTREDGRYVDAISVLAWSDMPSDIIVDKPKMIRKTILDPIEAIVNTLDWNFDEIEQMLERATPAEYYRDPDQMGLDAGNFM